MRVIADSQLRMDTLEKSLGRIWLWMRDTISPDRYQIDYRWRTASDVICHEHYYGCAEHALEFGCLARACSIPTIWVKSLDVPWIKNYVKTRNFDGGSGHVYLEVFLGARWCLLDATQDELFEEYDRTQRILPGLDVERYAYDKGGDARELVLSLDWEPWQIETQQFFFNFNTQLLDQAKPAVRGPGRRLSKLL